MIDPKLLATYRRLAGRRDMNRRNGGAHAGAHTMPASAMAYARSDCYQNAINDLCDAFQTTEGELTKAAEVAT